MLRGVISHVIERHPNFKRVNNRTIVYTPIEHFSKYIEIHNRTASRYFIVRWWINCLCEPSSRCDIKLGRLWGTLGRSTRFRPKGANGKFEVDDPTMADDFADQIEEKIIPLFESMDDFGKIRDFSLTHDAPFHGSWETWTTLIAVAMGDISAAQRIWRSADTDKIRWQVPNMFNDHPDFGEWCRLEEPLMAADRTALIKLLHEWERFQTTGTKLERHWTSTPFPIERIA